MMVLVYGTHYGQNIFKEDLSTYTVGQELSGQGLWSNSPIAPNVGIGACLPLSASQPCSGAKIAAQPVSYLGYGTSANSLILAPVQDGVAHIIDPVVTAGDLYVGLVLNITTAPTASGSPVDFLRIINSDPTLVTFRLLVKDTGFGYQIGIRKGASANATVYTNGSYNYNESVLVILKYSQLAGGSDDILNLYVNPSYSAGEPLTPTASTSTGADQSGAIDRVAFRLNYNVAASMPTGFAGLVSASTTWEGLSFVPLSVNQFGNVTPLQFSYDPNKGLQVSSTQLLTNATFEMYTTTGALVERKSLNLPSGVSEIKIPSSLTSGMYIVQIIANSGVKNTQKIIIP